MPSEKVGLLGFNFPLHPPLYRSEERKFSKWFYCSCHFAIIFLNQRLSHHPYRGMHMSFSKECQEFHLTPQGRVVGSFMGDALGAAEEVETPHMRTELFKDVFLSSVLQLVICFSVFSTFSLSFLLLPLRLG